MRLIKYLGREVSWQIIRHLQAAAARDDREVLYRRAEFWGGMAYKLVRSRRELLRSNLSLAFPEWQRQQARRTAEEIVAHLSRGIVDILHYPENRGLLSARLSVENQDVLDEVLAAGRGFILVTGHVGVFPFVGMPVLWHKRPYGVLARDPHDERLAALFRVLCAKLGITYVADKPPAMAVRNTLEILRRAGAVMFAFDMYPGHGRGVEVDFLGQRTPMFTGMIRIAARAGVPLVPVCILRKEDGVRHKVRFYPAIQVPSEAAQEDSPATLEVLSRLAEWLSDVVRRHPEQWWWIHRRWRPQPAAVEIAGGCREEEATDSCTPTGKPMRKQRK